MGKFGNMNHTTFGWKQILAVLEAFVAVGYGAGKAGNAHCHASRAELGSLLVLSTLTACRQI